MTKRNVSAPPSYSDQFKPAIQLRRPTLDQWADYFYATQLQEQFDSNGEHFLRLGRTLSPNPNLSTIVQLTTPVTGVAPLFRQVEVLGKKDYSAICVDAGPNQLGVCVYLLQTVTAKTGQPETYINIRYMPYAMLSDLVHDTTKAGLLELRLPVTDIAKLNVTLRPSPIKEPEYRTFKTEVLFENLPTDVQQRIENQLNFQSGSIAAFTGYQMLGACRQWPTGVGSQLSAEVGVPPWASSIKKGVVAILVSVGSVAGVVGQATDDNTLKAVGMGFVGAGVITNYWLNMCIRDWPENADPEDPPATGTVTV